MILLGLFISGCRLSAPEPPEEEPTNPQENVPTGAEAIITKVVVSGNPGSYTFNVQISSPDTGCDQYADWWEVFTPDSTLKHRRILAHSHVNEQPFSRSGGSINISANDFVYVRGHMNNLGYGSQVFSGSVASGLQADTLDTAYAQGLASQSPLPEKCDF